MEGLEAAFYIAAPFLFCPESNFFSDLKLHFKALQMHHINKMSHYLIPSDTNVSQHLMKAGEGGKAKLWKNSPKHNKAHQDQILNERRRLCQALLYKLEVCSS